ADGLGGRVLLEVAERFGDFERVSYVITAFSAAQHLAAHSALLASETRYPGSRRARLASDVRNPASPMEIDSPTLSRPAPQVCTTPGGDRAGSPSAPASCERTPAPGRRVARAALRTCRGLSEASRRSRPW